MMRDQPTILNTASFGYVLDGVPEDTAKAINDCSESLHRLLNIDKPMIGTGLLLKYHENLKNHSISVTDDEPGRKTVEIEIDKKCNAVLFSYIWAVAAINSEFIEPILPALHALLHTKLPQDEVNKRISRRWKSAEMGIESTLQSILHDNSDKESIAEIKSAIGTFHGSLDTAMPLTSHETMIAISRMKAGVEKAGGFLNHEKSSLLAMFVNMRAGCVKSLEKLSMLNQAHVVTPVNYLLRISQENPSLSTSQAITRFGPVLIASLTAADLGQEFHWSAPKELPTKEELDELQSRLPDVGTVLNGVPNNNQTGNRNYAPRF